MDKRDDILVPSPAEAASRFSGSKVAAFVPITVAVVGIAAILLGGISARGPMTAEVPALDTIATGSIAKAAP